MPRGRPRKVAAQASQAPVEAAAPAAEEEASEHECADAHCSECCK